MLSRMDGVWLRRWSTLALDIQDAAWSAPKLLELILNDRSHLLFCESNTVNVVSYLRLKQTAPRLWKIRGSITLYLQPNKPVWLMDTLGCWHLFAGPPKTTSLFLHWIGASKSRLKCAGRWDLLEFHLPLWSKQLWCLLRRRCSNSWNQMPDYWRKCA